MPRKMSRKNEKEFEELSQFLSYFSTHFWKMDIEDDSHPYIELKRIVHKYGESEAFQGLRQAINDIIEATQDLKNDELKKIDNDLASENIITLSGLRKKYWKKFDKIINNGIINNDTEYYVIIGLLSDTTQSYDKECIRKLNKLIADYESRVRTDN